MAGETATAATKTVDLSLFKVDRHGRSMYRANGNKNTTVRFGASFFAGKPADSIQIISTGVATQVGPKQKLTKEERAALPKPTPAQKLEQARERAARAQARAERLEKALAAQAAKSGSSEASGDAEETDASEM